MNSKRSYSDVWRDVVFAMDLPSDDQADAMISIVCDAAVLVAGDYRLELVDVLMALCKERIRHK